MILWFFLAWHVTLKACKVARSSVVENFEPVEESPESLTSVVMETHTACSPTKWLSKRCLLQANQICQMTCVIAPIWTSFIWWELVLKTKNNKEDAEDVSMWELKVYIFFLREGWFPSRQKDQMSYIIHCKVFYPGRYLLSPINLLYKKC